MQMTTADEHNELTQRLGVQVVLCTVPADVLTKNKAYDGD
jgi:hypothetical protein